jgi:hypothetical protein
MTGYTSTIPASPNDPADDQPLMLANFSAIATWVDVDHVGFNVSGYGTHEQVTFAANNVPITPVAPPILFTNNKDGVGNTLPASLAEMFFYSGTTAQSSSQYIALPSGSTMTLGGIIIKWGATGAIGDNGIVTFASPFPNSCFAVQLTITDPNASTKTINVKSGLTLSNFTVRVSSGTISAYYLAIGN